jgi:hypothetical protein
MESAAPRIQSMNGIYCAFKVHGRRLAAALAGKVDLLKQGVGITPGQSEVPGQLIDTPAPGAIDPNSQLRPQPVPHHRLIVNHV